ncbi:MAG TPA: hypothetical protein VFZ68_15175 [Acidimicrobiales bacterium]
MGQPITVVEKPSRIPGVVRFETNRSFTGMGHERFDSPDEILADRPVDELARRLFATGAVRAVHTGGSVVTVELADGASSDGLADVIRGLYIYYPPADGVDEPVSGPAREEADEREVVAGAPTASGGSPGAGSASGDAQ